MANGKKGRKSKYDELDIETRLPEIEGYARDGYRDEDIYNTLGIARQTYYNWMEKYPEFAEAVRKGKRVVDAEIENKLLDNARGHVFWEETQELAKVKNPETGRIEEKLITTKKVLKYVKPDTTAQIFWLKNRKPDVWRDKQHVEHEGQIGVTGLDYMSDEELEKALKEMGADE
jgi:DNA-binding XRE family transcriptional regulator